METFVSWLLLRYCAFATQKICNPPKQRKHTVERFLHSHICRENHLPLNCLQPQLDFIRTAFRL